jgi:hypothetical protein
MLARQRPSLILGRDPPSELRREDWLALRGVGYEPEAVAVPLSQRSCPYPSPKIVYGQSLQSWTKPARTGFSQT